LQHSRRVAACLSVYPIAVFTCMQRGTRRGSSI
jgi:hypothetical protein